MIASSMGHAIGLGVVRHVTRQGEVPRFVRALDTLAYSVDEMLANAKGLPEAAGSWVRLLDGVYLERR